MTDDVIEEHGKDMNTVLHGPGSSCILLRNEKEITYTIIVESIRWRQLLEWVETTDKEDAVMQARRMCAKYPMCLVFVKYNLRDGRRGYFNHDGTYSLTGDNWN